MQVVEIYFSDWEQRTQLLTFILLITIYKNLLGKFDSLIGVHIEMGFPNMDFSEVRCFCKKNNIELYHEPSDVCLPNS